tara:strand:+ start:324 stop:839 length:516 start_codon:yes stop_codon:yes gene_type:complete
MTSTISAATMTVTLKEAITLNGYDQGSKNTLTVEDISNVSKSTITCLSGAEVAILGVSAAGSTDLGKSYLSGQFDEDDVRYIRITNKDDTNYVFLTMRNSGDSGAQEVAVKLDKGSSFIYGVDLDGGTESTLWGSASAISVAANSTIYNLIDIVGIANTADVELEVFVATV